MSKVLTAAAVGPVGRDVGHGSNGWTGWEENVDGILRYL